MIWPLSVTGAPEPCSIVTLRDCRSIAATTNRRRMGKTGSRSTARAASFCMMAGARSMQRRGSRSEERRVGKERTGEAGAALVEKKDGNRRYRVELDEITTV